MQISAKWTLVVLLVRKYITTCDTQICLFLHFDRQYLITRNYRITLRWHSKTKTDTLKLTIHRKVVRAANKIIRHMLRTHHRKALSEIRRLCLGNRTQEDSRHLFVTSQKQVCRLQRECSGFIYFQFYKLDVFVKEISVLIK